jgi:glycosyltransferase involved in cell wall biosynthesis
VSTKPLVSVVVPTYNRLSRLRRVVAALEDQTLPRDEFEIVVVSDGSADGTDAYLTGACAEGRLTFATQPNQGPAAARNRGVELARGDLVLFVDDDVVATPQLVARHVASHDAIGRDAIVIGPMITPPGFRMRPWVQWEQAMLYKQYDALTAGRFAPTFRQFYTGNASLPRARFTAAGGFDTRFRRAEDVELAYRLHRDGIEFVWNRRAVGLHYADRPFESWLRTAYDYGAYEVVFCRDEEQDPRFLRVRAEYRGRNPLIRGMARLGVVAPAVATGVRSPLRGVAVTAARLGASTVSRLALSVLFNTSYYLGMAEELGGPDRFRDTIVRASGPTGS